LRQKLSDHRGFFDPHERAGNGATTRNPAAVLKIGVSGKRLFSWPVIVRENKRTTKSYLNQRKE
jgi:hypothetical protein